MGPGQPAGVGARPGRQGEPPPQLLPDGALCCTPVGILITVSLAVPSPHCLFILGVR